MLNLRTQSYLVRHGSGFYPTVIGAEQALLVLSEAGTGVWSFAAGAQRAVLSQVARQLLGVGDGAEFPSTDGWLDHIHPADRVHVQVEIDRVVDEPGPFLFEARIVTGAGEARWIEVDGQSHHEEGCFLRAGGTVRAAGRRRRTDLVRDLRIGASLPCARRPANLGMIAATVVDEMQAFHPTRAIHLVLSGQLDGEWDADRISQAIANLVAKALEGESDRPVVLRVSGSGLEVQVLIEGCGPAIRRPSIAQEIVRAHGGTLDEIPSNALGMRFLAVLPKCAG